MNLKHAIPVLASTLLIAGAAVADQSHGKNKNKNRNNQDRASTSAASAGLGTAEANRRGASAGALIGSQVEVERQGRNAPMVDANTATTFGTGAIYTDRNTASGAVSTGGTASGTGAQSTSSNVGAYGETTRQGSTADVYGDSTAQSQPRQQQRRPR